MRTLFIALAAATLVAACRQSPPGRCSTHGDCPPGRECAAGVCVELVTDSQVGSRCIRDTDCVSWASCASERCTLAPGRCGGDADCAAWELCSTATRGCVNRPNGCPNDSGCASWQSCVSYQCQTAAGHCAANVDCSSWQICDGSHVCALIPGACEGDPDCATWQTCAAHACTAAPGHCATSASCTAWQTCDASHVCAPAPGRCATGADCASYQTCDGTHTCVTAPGFCGSFADCQLWEVCDASHTCANGPGYCASNADCAAWQQCNALHACVAAPGFCATSAQCQAWEICNAGHTCENGPQYCASNSTCASWQLCGTQHVCVPGLRRCDANADCKNGWQACGIDHTCETAPGYCLDSSDCVAPQLCYGDHLCKTPPAICASNWDCPWYTRCEGPLQGETCHLLDAIGNYPQHCDSDAQCGALACRGHRCVQTWHVSQVSTPQAAATCALTSGQGVWCWGWGNSNVLGADPTVMGGPYLTAGTTGATGLAVVGGASFVTYADGTVHGWGSNENGELCEPAGNPAVRATPGPAIPALEGVTQIHGSPICGIDASSNLVCWGGNTYGAILGAGWDVETPTTIAGLPSGVTAFDASGHVCAVAAGELWCWAGTFSNGCGQTGQPQGVTGVPPSRVELGAPVLDVATGAGGFTCAIVQGGAVKCWGCNYYGNIGNGATSLDPVLVPTDVVGLAGPAAHVEVTDWTACALLASGGVQCWGRGDRGYLANGDLPEAQVKPRYALGLESGVTQLDMGSTACAVKTDGTLWCWGWAHDWAINGDFGWPFYYPVQVNGPP